MSPDVPTPTPGIELLLAAERLLCRAAMAVAGALLVLLMLLSGGNVLLRLLGRPSGASYELSGFCGALVAALALAETQRVRQHITVDILSCRFPPGARRALRAANGLAGLALMTLIAAQVINRSALLRRAGEVSETLNLPYAPFMVAAAAGLLLLAGSYLVDLILACAGSADDGARAP